MATRSTITVKISENKYKTIYCHWDGYLSNNGLNLYENVTTKEKALALLEKGDMSSLRFDQDGNNISEYYKDRGEENTDAREIRDINQIDWQGFNYLWEDGQWKVDVNDNFDPLIDALMADNESRPRLKQKPVNYCPHCGKKIE